MALMLVHPRPRGNGGDPPSRRKRSRSASLFLTPDESRALRASVKNLARAFGSLACLADVLGVRPDVLTSKRRPSAALALAVARAGGVSVESVLSASMSDASRCKACGHKLGDGRIAAAGGAS